MNLLSTVMPMFENKHTNFFQSHVTDKHSIQIQRGARHGLNTVYLWCAHTALNVTEY